jgi:hypothetical protein
MIDGNNYSMALNWWKEGGGLSSQDTRKENCCNDTFLIIYIIYSASQGVMLSK